VTTIHERIAAAGITMTCKPGKGPAPEGFPEGTTSWRVTLKFPARGSSLTTDFHMGPGHGAREPEVAEVLDVLLSDAATINNATSFEDFCSDFGYDDNSRRIERLYYRMSREADKLEAFLGDDCGDFQDWLYETERL
jgi:hypothetical protein